jgi:phosphoribosylanthranilate isomerase
LFVNPSDDDLARVLDALRLDTLQLYVGAERAREIRERFSTPVWRAVGVGSASDLPIVADGADAMLVEAKAPEGATRPGGNAARFDWELLSNWTAPGPWVLAGGLDPSNVAQAIRVSGARAVDVSSGVERAKGVKDPALIRAFIAAAKGVA